MKNRFHWEFELLIARIYNSTNDFLRGVNPSRERRVLVLRLEEAIEYARLKQQEFPGHEQYSLFLDDYQKLVGSFLTETKGADDIEQEISDLKEQVTELQDHVRLIQD